MITDLMPGQTYQVIEPFTNYDGLLHPAGETWRLIEQHFLPYEDGVSLLVEKDGQPVWFRLQWREEAQGEILDHFTRYVKKV